MHPGPINRGVEIDSAVVDGTQSVILPQVTFGIAVRMAVMSIVAGKLKRMKILIRNGRVIDPASRLRRDRATSRIAAGRVIGVGSIAGGLQRRPRHRRRRAASWRPGLVDLAARLREPGYEYEGMLESEMAAAVAGGVTSLVCPPDTDPVLDEPGLVEMLQVPRREAAPGARVTRWARSRAACRARC